VTIRVRTCVCVCVVCARRCAGARPRVCIRVRRCLSVRLSTDRRPSVCRRHSCIAVARSHEGRCGLSAHGNLLVHALAPCVKLSPRDPSVVRPEPRQRATLSMRQLLSHLPRRVLFTLALVQLNVTVEVVAESLRVGRVLQENGSALQLCHVPASKWVVGGVKWGASVRVGGMRQGGRGGGGGIMVYSVTWAGIYMPCGYGRGGGGGGGSGCACVHPCERARGRAGV
jgi:hypothetical protein